MMDLTEDCEPIVLLNDGESFSGLGGCELIVLTQEEAERVAADGCLAFVKEVEARRRTFDLEAMVRFAFQNGFGKP
jgi:hypothetical protein